MGIQLVHAGRKAQDAHQPVAPSAIAYSDDYQTPSELTIDEIKTIEEEFVAGAKRAKEASYNMIEIHGAHGYLINQFLSPVTNKRTDP